MEKKVLDLPLKAKWYDMIESGEKTEEYREIKPYWETRFIDMEGLPSYTHYDEVKFRYGYTKRTMTFECLGIEQGFGKPEWGAPNEEVFIIKLGKRIK